MNLSLFISKRIIKADQGSFSSKVNAIAIASIALGLAIMIVCFVILSGFESTIKEKIYSFNGHVHITKITMNNSYEQVPMEDLKENRNALRALPEVRHLQEFAHKAALLKTEEEVQGILLKGVGPDFDFKTFQENMVEGSFIKFKKDTPSSDIVISRVLATQLNLKVGEEIVLYFVQVPVRLRKVKISGIFDTSMEEFDQQIVIGDISIIRKINKWADNQTGGYEVFLNNLEDVEFKVEKMANLLTYYFYLEEVRDKYLEIFEWLTLLNQNGNIFLGLILIVASVNMISILLIMIMERTPMIGILKTLGATNSQIRRIFFYNGFQLMVKGIILGNVLALTFCYLQYKFKFIPLDPQNYYMKYVPIFWDWPVIIFLNIVIALVISMVLILPTLLVTRITPVKAIKFD